MFLRFRPTTLTVTAAAEIGVVFLLPMVFLTPSARAQASRPEDELRRADGRWSLVVREADDADLIDGGASAEIILEFAPGKEPEMQVTNVVSNKRPSDSITRSSGAAMIAIAAKDWSVVPDFILKFEITDAAGARFSGTRLVENPFFLPPASRR